MQSSAYRLLARAWNNLVSALGTTTLSVVVFSLAVPVLIFLAVLMYRALQSRKQGGGMKAAVKGTIVPTLIGAGITVIAWLCLFGWSLMTTTYRDHVGLLERIRQLNREKQALAESSRRQIDGLKSRLETKPKEIIRTRTVTVPAPAVPPRQANPEIQREITQIADLADRGSQIQDAFVKVGDTERLKKDYGGWVRDVTNALNKIDASYVTQFRNAHGSAMMGCPNGRSVEGCGYWQDISGKISLLMTIISELRRSR